MTYLIDTMSTVVVMKALEQGRKGRKRVQKKIGESLTEEESLKRLKLEEEERAKKSAAKKIKNDDGTLVEPTPRIKKGKKPKAALKKKILLELSSDSAEDNCPVVDSDDLSTGDCEDEDVVPIEVGSYYLVKIDFVRSKPLYALAKLTEIMNDAFVKMQFYKTVPLEKRLKYVPWSEPESTDAKLLSKKIPLPSVLIRGGMLLYNEGIIPSWHIK